MKTFTDSTGRAWNLELTIAGAKRIKSICDVDLMDLQAGEPPLLFRLEKDVILLMDVIFALVKPQADAAGITDQQFGQAMNGPAAGAAADAFWEELTDFFRSTRPALVELIESGRELEKARIESLRASRERALEKIKTLGQSSTSSPESSGATPAP